MPTRIPPEEAAKHLIEKPSPNYPQFAELTRITGNVILQISIDDSGTASVQHVMSGHPLLVQAAIDAVNHWKYQPFEVDGKPATVVTMVMVTFGNAVTHDAENRADMLFQHDYWTAVESAQAAIAKGDYARSEEQLNKARELASHRVGMRNAGEGWQWLTTMGHLRMMQQKYDEAEEYYRKALALYQNGDKDAPDRAASLASLGNLFAEEKRFDRAHDHLVRAVDIYKRNFKKVGSRNLSAQQVYGRAIAYQAWMLSKLASQRNDPVDADKQCRTVLEFQSFLSTTDRESFVSTCEQTIKSPPAK